MSRMLGNAGLYFAVAGVLLWALFPLWYAGVTSLTPPSELFAAHWWVEAPYWANYKVLFCEQPFGRFLFNSVMVALGVTGFSIALALPAAHAIARIPFRGRRALLFSFLALSMFPQVAVLSGLFELVGGLGLYNSLWGLGLAYLILTLPFTVWILSAFLRALPPELDEAALVDGASRLTVLLRIHLPLLAPAVGTTALLAFIAAWNEFLFALTLTLTEQSRTVPVAIALMSGASVHELPWGRVMAASVLVTLPLVLVALLFQRRLVAGLTAGAVKS